jgi:hypothetical protein
MSIVPQFSKLGEVEDKVKRNNFHFGSKFKFQIEFELKIQEAIEFEFGLNF